MKKELKSFVNEVISRINGDDAAVKAEKIRRKALSAIKSQIATLESAIVDAEINVENKQEALENSIYSTVVFEDNQSYCEGIAQAQNELEEAEDGLIALRDSMDFFSVILKDRL